jgi:hypothetical protein
MRVSSHAVPSAIAVERQLWAQVPSLLPEAFMQLQ